MFNLQPLLLISAPSVLPPLSLSLFLASCHHSRVDRSLLVVMLADVWLWLPESGLAGYVLVVVVVVGLALLGTIVCGWRSSFKLVVDGGWVADVGIVLLLLIVIDCVCDC